LNYFSYEPPYLLMIDDYCEQVFFRKPFGITKLKKNLRFCNVFVFFIENVRLAVIQAGTLI